MLFFSAIVLILLESSAVLFYWEEIITRIESNWWLSFLSFFGVITRSFVWGVIKSGVISLVVDGALSFLFKYKPVASGLKVVNHYKESKLIAFRCYWDAELKIKRVIILSAFLPIFLITVGFVLYTPLSKKIAINTVKKKSGAKIILLLSKSIIKIKFMYLIGKILRIYSKKLSIKMIRLYRKFKSKE